MATIKKNKMKAGWMPQTPEHTRGELTPERTADIKYLQSAYWRSVRQQVLNRDLGLCQEKNIVGFFPKIIGFIENRIGFSGRDSNWGRMGQVPTYQPLDHKG